MFLNCLVEQTKALAWLRGWGLRLDLLYQETDGQNPAVSAVYRALAICMFAIGMYEIKVPFLNDRVKVRAFLRPAFALLRSYAQFQKKEGHYLVLSCLETCIGPGLLALSGT